MPGRFAEALIEELRLRARDDITLLPFLAPLIRGARNGFADQPVDNSGPSPDALPQCLSSLAVSQALAAEIPAVAGLCAWRSVITAHPDVDPALSAGMHAAHVLGDLGILNCPGLRGGFFTLAPDIHYPLHSHKAAELYFCLSGTVRIQHGLDGKPVPLAPGACSITPTGRVHSLTTGKEPVLLFFAWVGEMTAPIHWWHREEDGIWSRSIWNRDMDGVWIPGQRTPINPADVEQQLINESR